MKQLAKEQLAEMIHDSSKKIIDLNISGMTERILDSIKGSGDNCSELMVKLVVAYGAEMMQICNQVLAETLDHVLNAE